MTDVTLTDPEAPGSEAPPPASPPTPESQGWRKDKAGRWVTPARGRGGFVYRKGNETIDEAHARDSKGPKDKAPKAKPKTPKAPAPTQVSLKELEFALTEALSSPSMIAAMQGDEWAANHFVQQAPILSRNLTKAAEHNPWLRAKLEATMSGDVLLMRLMTLFPVVSAAIAYTVPPLIFYLNPPFIGEEARAMFGVPHRDKRRDQERDHAESAQGPPPAAAPETADAVSTRA